MMMLVEPSKVNEFVSLFVKKLRRSYVSIQKKFEAVRRHLVANK